MECITIQKYAAQNHMSIHTVIKKTMNGELPTLIKEENGKEVTYILLNPTESEEIDTDYKKEYELLHIEYLLLKAKYEKLLEAHTNS